jgi:uncharacterized protein (DUF2141 family)
MGLSLLALLLATIVPPGGPGGVIEVAVVGVRSAAGHVKVDVCTRDTFLKDCPWSARAPAHPGTVIVAIHGVPPGRYAIQAFHDANDNGELDQGLFGIPKEGLGFSNDGWKGWSRPRFDNAAFDFSGATQRLVLHLRHMLG